MAAKDHSSTSPQPSRTTRRRSTRSSSHARGPVSTNALADRLGVTAASASNMAKKLDQLGPRGARALQGRAPDATRAPGSRSRCMRHHRLLELYLAETLGRALGPRPRRGRGARARAVRGARGADRPQARQPDRTIRTGTRSPRATSHSTRVTPQSMQCARARGVAARSCASPTPTPRCCATSPSAGSRPGDTFEIVGKQPFGGPVSARFGDAGAGARRRARTRDAGGGEHA